MRFLKNKQKAIYFVGKIRVQFLFIIFKKYYSKKIIQNRPYCKTVKISKNTIVALFFCKNCILKTQKDKK